MWTSVIAFPVILILCAIFPIHFVLHEKKEAEQVEICQLGQLAAPKSQSNISWLNRLWPRKKSELPATEASNECRYVCLRGIVEPAEKSRLLKSVDNKSTGVIHKILTKEITTVRNGSRFW